MLKFYSCPVFCIIKNKCQMAGQQTYVAIISENDLVDLVDRKDKNFAICLRWNQLLHKKVVHMLFSRCSLKNQYIEIIGNISHERRFDSRCLLQILYILQILITLKSRKFACCYYLHTPTIIGGICDLDRISG